MTPKKAGRDRISHPLNRIRLENKHRIPQKNKNGTFACRANFVGVQE